MTKDLLHDDLAEGAVPFDPADYSRKANAAGLVDRVKAHGPWYEELILSQRGVPKVILANAIMALRKAPQWDNVLWHNEFTTATVARQRPPWEADKADWRERQWTDHDDLMAAEWLQHAGIYVGHDIAAKAVQVVAGERPFHPVREYLDSLNWDGICRMDNWVVNYLGVETSAYARAVGRRFLIAAVARIYRPGCKADCALILEGEQGTWKSTALKTLTEPWFTDEIADFGSKDAAEQTVGVWLVELAELGSLSRPEVGKIKAFMSRSTDRFRPAYGRRVTEFPRQCVFAGTVNDDDYLRDETGGRRFWPIKCGTIEIAKLANSRDQLWAEATEAYRSREPWWLDTDQLKRAASEPQAARYQGDPWDCEIRQYIEPTNEAGEPITEETKESVSVGEILTKVLQIEKGRWSQHDLNRVARCLKSMGWVRYQERDGAKRTWRYREKPVTSSD